jgi:hypothetical protein
MPPDAWWAESAHAETQQCESAVSAVPHNFKLQLRAGGTVIPQSGKPVSVVPAVPLANSRLKLRRDLLQIEGMMEFSWIK